MKNLKKGNTSIFEYVLKTKVLSDELQIVGWSMSEEKLMSFLSGLNEQFDNMFSTIIEKCWVSM